MLTFYGHFSGDSSYPVVCRAIAKSLAGHGVDVRIGNLRDEPTDHELGGFLRVDDYVMQATWRLWGAGGGRGSRRNRPPEVPGTSLLFGFPDWHAFLPRHERRIGYHTVEYPPMAPDMVELVSGLDVALCPSRWCQAIFQGATQQQWLVIPHGVDTDVFAPSRAEQHHPLDYPGRRPFRFVHFCSTEETGRKATMQTLHAWGRLQQSIDAELVLVLRRPEDRHGVMARQKRPGVYQWLEKVVGWTPRVEVLVRGPVPSHAQSRTIRSCHVVVAPSRAEGFGMIPREALACGVPVVATLCTGHADHLTAETPGLVPVEHGPNAQCENGRAPRVSSMAIEAAMLDAYERWPELRAAALDNAATVGTEWHWDNVLKPLVELLGET